MLGFGVGQTAEGIVFAVFGTFTLFYFNQVLEISAALTGLALGIALFFDAISDPLAGSISDRLKTRWGRRHPMIALSAVPLGVCVVALFNPPSGMPDLFYFGWLVVFAVLSRLFLTLYHIPHLALGAEMAQDYVDRTRVYSYSQLFGTLGIYGFSFLMLTFIFPTTDEASHGLLNRNGYLPFSLSAACGIIVSIGLFMWGTFKEIPYLPKVTFKAEERLRPQRLFREVVTAFRNRSYRMLFGGLLFAVILLGIEAAFMVYMYIHFWELPTESMRWLGPTTLCALPISIVLAPILTARFEKRRILIVLSTIIIVNTNVPICLRLFTDLMPANGTPELLPLLLCFAFIAGLAGPAVMVTLNSMFADIADEQELITGERQEGIIFSARSFAFKAAGALASILGGVALDLISFPRGAAPGEVDADILFMLGAVAGPLTSIFGLINLLFYLGYRLSRERIKEIQLELMARRQQSTPSDE
jgi:Na+/melibiose symporter-like transporter|tara:strand:+ start:5948 stop:7369 length:1422 start_codon:yes stop_codon:yes gene_type:complete